MKKDGNLRTDLDPSVLKVEPAPTVDEIKLNVRKFLHPDREEFKDANQTPSANQNNQNDGGNTN